jgi:hypothetical protein
MSACGGVEAGGGGDNPELLGFDGHIIFWPPGGWLPPVKVEVVRTEPAVLVEDRPAYVRVRLTNTSNAARHGWVRAHVVPVAGEGAGLCANDAGYGLCESLDEWDTGMIPPGQSREGWLTFLAPWAGLSHSLKPYYFEKWVPAGDVSTAPGPTVAETTAFIDTAARYRFELEHLKMWGTRSVCTDNNFAGVTIAYRDLNKTGSGANGAFCTSDAECASDFACNKQESPFACRNWQVGETHARYAGQYSRCNAQAAMKPLGVSSDLFDLLPDDTHGIKAAYQVLNSGTPAGAQGTQKALDLISGAAAGVLTAIYGNGDGWDKIDEFTRGINSTVFADCDGAVVSDGKVFTGRQLELWTRQRGVNSWLAPWSYLSKTFKYKNTPFTPMKFTESPDGCNIDRSDYDIDWSFIREHTTQSFEDYVRLLGPGRAVHANETVQLYQVYHFGPTGQAYQLPLVWTVVTPGGGRFLDPYKGVFEAGAGAPASGDGIVEIRAETVDPFDFGNGRKEKIVGRLFLRFE